MAIGTTAAIIGGSLIGAASSIYGSDKAGDAAKDASGASVAEQRRQFDTVRGDTQGLRDIGNSALGSIARLYGYAPPGAKPAAAPLSFAQWSQQNGGGFGGGFGMGIPGRIGAGAPGLQKGYADYLASQRAQPRGTGQPDMSGFFASPDYQFRLTEGQRAIDSSAAARGGLLSGAAVKAGTRYASNLASGEYGAFYDRLAQQAGLGVTGIGASAAAGANAANNISNSYLQGGQARGSAYLAGAQGINNAAQGGISNWMLSKYLGG